MYTRWSGLCLKMGKKNPQKGKFHYVWKWKFYIGKFLVLNQLCMEVY